MRYVIKEEYDELEQRCLAECCDFINSVFEEPRRNCLLCGGQFGAFRAYGTVAERAERLVRFEASIAARA